MPTTQTATEFSPEFSEEDLIGATDRFLGGFEGRTGFRQFLEIARITQRVEGELGYDGVLTSVVPFFLQFKTAHFCTSSHGGKLRNDRDTLGLVSNRGFYRFSLMKDKSTRQFDQHNTLYTLAQQHRAAYIAPSFYRRTHLIALKRRRDDYPWTYERFVHLHDGPGAYCVIMRNVRRIAGLITIPPHKTVVAQQGVGHQYSFVGQGDIAFHEAERVGNETPRFIDFLLNLIPTTTKAASSLSLDELAGQVLRLMAKVLNANIKGRIFRNMLLDALLTGAALEEEYVSHNPMKAFNSLNAVEKLSVFERFLWNHFQIRQYIMFLYERR